MIGIGVDVVDIERFRTSLTRTPTMRDRLFTQIELAYVAPQADPVPSLAARFAAREAVMKSLGRYMKTSKNRYHSDMEHLMRGY